ncbi:hypothetical protein [Robbsia sp. KACC 23696]|uniref:hypothetical protein n=1 Tax=Robbsia sp. KACC 23696 TaxID=3149231 RepID=UPI00325A712C
MSVQFHPEFTVALIRHCLTRHRNASSRNGNALPPETTGTSASSDTPHAHRLLLRFVASLA